MTENHAALPREVEVEARADAALIKGLPAPDGGKRHRRRGHQTEAVNRRVSTLFLGNCAGKLHL